MTDMVRKGRVHQGRRRFARSSGAASRSVAGAVVALARERSGSVAVFATLIVMVLVGASALVFDGGRMAVLKTQMQNAADAAALAAAVELDGFSGARARAQTVAENAATQTSLIETTGNSSIIAISDVSFFSAYTPSRVAAVDDEGATAVRVTIEPRSIELLLEPALALISDSVAKRVTELNASAAATTDPIVCNAPPLMMCDPLEMSPPVDLGHPSNVGRQVNIKEGPGGVPSAPGQFGLLCLPTGECGANAIGEALAATAQARCMSTDVTTAPGSKTVQVENGLNARFDIGNRTPHNPAGNVINFPHDINMSEQKVIGNGNWPRGPYWSDKHNGAPLPVELQGATRYQTYLYELGESFAANGKRTLYPVPSQMAAGFQVVTPPGANVPVAVDAANRRDPDFDGVPQTTPVPDPRRRLIKVALLKCQELGVAGSDTYPTHGRFVEMFVTQEVRGPSDPYGSRIMGEVVRMLTSRNSLEFLANARLLD